MAGDAAAERVGTGTPPAWEERAGDELVKGGTAPDAAANAIAGDEFTVPTDAPAAPAIADVPALADPAVWADGSADIADSGASAHALGAGAGGCVLNSEP